MTSAIKNQRVCRFPPQKANQMLSRFSILVLVSLLCWGITQPVLAISLFQKPMVIAQQKDSKVPPAVVNAVRQDLSRRTNIATEQLTLKAASRQTWPDGCLGLATPDELCAQALVEGWRVVISNKAQSWVYRTDNQGRVIRLEN